LFKLLQAVAAAYTPTQKRDYSKSSSQIRKTTKFKLPAGARKFPFYKDRRRGVARILAARRKTTLAN
jgi:hypothetical protein